MITVDCGYHAALLIRSRERVDIDGPKLACQSPDWDRGASSFAVDHRETERQHLAACCYFPDPCRAIVA